MRAEFLCLKSLPRVKNVCFFFLFQGASFGIWRSKCACVFSCTITKGPLV